MGDAFAVGVKGAADRLGGTGLIGADFVDVVGTKIANKAVQQGLRLRRDQRAGGDRIVVKIGLGRLESPAPP